MRNIPELIKIELEVQLDREARKLVAQMELAKPIPEIVINYTWGDAPGGAVSLARTHHAGIYITIYATAETSEHSDFHAVARWHEFGTSERVTKDGQYRGLIAASPYFWPVWRADKPRVRRNLRRAVTRGVKKT